MKDLNKVLIVMLLIFWCAPAAAQDNLKKSDDFFKSDFAKNPLQGNDKAQMPQPKPLKPKPHTTPIAVKTAIPTATPSVKAPKAQEHNAGDALKKMSAALGGADGAAEDGSAMENEPGVVFSKTLPAVAISVILNAQDKKHASAKIDELLSLTKRYKIRIAKIYSLGGIPDALSKSQWAALMAAGPGISSNVVAIPERFKDVKLSPAWIVETPEGEVVLEATGPLRRHFTEHGEVKL